MLRAVDPHRRSQARSLAYHRAVAERLRVDPALLARARARVEGWLATGEVHSEYAARWREILASPLDGVCAALTADDDEARTLRSVTPFAGALDPRERWRIWRDVGAERGA